MRNFFKQTFASLLGSLLGLMIFCGLGTTAFLLLLFTAASKDTIPDVSDKSVVVFDLSMKITDAEPTSSQLLEIALSGSDQERMTLRRVIDTIDKARQDPRIVAIYLDITNPQTGNVNGFASLKEIRRALQEFRAAGKRIIAYGVDLGQREYYLSSVADTVIINPLGIMEVKGLSNESIFLAGALQKYGIGVQVLQQGKFKGAVEPFTRSELSLENRLQLQNLLTDVWTDWRNTVASSRKVSSEKLQQLADTQGLFTAEDANSNGLVDKIAYQDQVITDLSELTGEDKQQGKFRQIKLSNYAEAPSNFSTLKRNSPNKIAVVYAEGEIVNGMGGDDQVGGDRFAKIFQRLRQKDDIKAVVLRINSPGGSATASEVIQREIRLTREIKPVVVSMGDIAASGGYWIASDSHRIFAEENTITGSIGVFGLLFNGQKIANDHGITWDSVETAKFADTKTLTRPKSNQELAVYQRAVNRIYQMFLDKVAQGRKLPAQKVAEIAQGRVWSGIAAKDIGLVDEIGGLRDAIAYAANQAQVGEDWELQEYPKTSTLEQRLLGKVSSEIRTIFTIQAVPVGLSDSLMADLENIRQEMAILPSINDPHGVYARLPFNFRIQ